MLLNPIAALILVSSTMRLSFIQDLFQLTGKLQDNIGNNTNVALKEALEAMATEVKDLHTDLCIIKQSREK